MKRTMTPLFIEAILQSLTTIDEVKIFSVALYNVRNYPIKTYISYSLVQDASQKQEIWYSLFIVGIFVTVI